MQLFCDSTVFVYFATGFLQSGSRHSPLYLSGLVLSNAQLTFYNITGQQVKQISLGDAQNTFTTEIDLNQGLYFYELINNKSTLSRGKLVVE